MLIVLKCHWTANTDEQYQLQGLLFMFVEGLTSAQDCFLIPNCKKFSEKCLRRSICFLLSLLLCGCLRGCYSMFWKQRQTKRERGCEFLPPSKNFTLVFICIISVFHDWFWTLMQFPKHHLFIDNLM